MKKITFLCLLSLVFPAISLADGGLYPGFASTIMTNTSNPNAPIWSRPLIWYTYFSRDSHVMPVYDSTGYGALLSQYKIDTVFTRPPTNQRYLIRLTISEGVDENITKPICTLSYNMLTKSFTWIVNKPYKYSDAHPGLECRVRVYPHHIF